MEIEVIVREVLKKRTLSQELITPSDKGHPDNMTEVGPMGEPKTNQVEDPTIMSSMEDLMITTIKVHLVLELVKKAVENPITHVVEMCPAQYLVDSNVQVCSAKGLILTKGQVSLAKEDTVDLCLAENPIQTTMFLIMYDSSTAR